MKASDQPIIVDKILPASPLRIWKAITDLNEMKQWYFDKIPSFEPQTGFKTQFTIHNEGRTFTHQWEVKEVVPEQRVTTQWTFKEYPGKGMVTFELQAKGHQTLFRVINITTEDFPSEIPEFKRESCIGGWEYFIQQRLLEYLSD